MAFSVHHSDQTAVALSRKTCCATGNPVYRAIAEERHHRTAPGAQMPQPFLWQSSAKAKVHQRDWSSNSCDGFTQGLVCQDSGHTTSGESDFNSSNLAVSA